MSRILMTDRPRGYLWTSAAANGMRYHIYDEAGSDLYMPLTLCGVYARNDAHLTDDESWDEVFASVDGCRILCCPKCVTAARRVAAP